MYKSSPKRTNSTRFLPLQFHCQDSLGGATRSMRKADKRDKKKVSYTC